MCEARAIDGIIAFGTHKEAAKYLGVAASTLQNQLCKAYRQFESQGVALSCDQRTKRVEVITLWLLYWWSEEGKANLRKVSLTQPPLA